jgi:hypothetical protein
MAAQTAMTLCRAALALGSSRAHNDDKGEKNRG